MLSKQFNLNRFVLTEGTEDRNFSRLQGVLQMHPLWKQLKVTRRDPGTARIDFIGGPGKGHSLVDEILNHLEDNDIYDTNAHRNYIVVYLYDM